ncbi:MAG TPA: hypothetical protein VN620_13405, partial [Candidatus Methylomirabilis sp.]|nr:hypothetical protein [Candidatus Methylomirabilis sp.]
MTEQAYIQILRSIYLHLPNTYHHFSRSDRRLASTLYQRGFSLDLVRSALFLATARRLARNPVEPPLPPVRSLHYFLPVLEEIKLQPLPSGYVQYLESKVRAASL